MEEFTRVINKQVKTNFDQWNKVLLGQSALTLTPEMYNVKTCTIRKQAIEHGFKTSLKDGNLVIYK